MLVKQRKISVAIMILGYILHQLSIWNTTISNEPFSTGMAIFLIGFVLWLFAHSLDRNIASLFNIILSNRFFPLFSNDIKSNKKDEIETPLLVNTKYSLSEAQDTLQGCKNGKYRIVLRSKSEDFVVIDVYEIIKNSKREE